MTRHIVARTSDIPHGGNKVVAVDGRDIVVFHVNGEFFALLNRCPHAGAPLEKAASINPNSSDAYGFLGWAYFGLKDAENFKKAAGKARTLGSKDEATSEALRKIWAFLKRGKVPPANAVALPLPAADTQEGKPKPIEQKVDDLTKDMEQVKLTLRRLSDVIDGRRDEKGFPLPYDKGLGVELKELKDKVDKLEKQINARG